MERGGMNSKAKAVVATGLAGLAVSAGAIYLEKRVIGQDEVKIEEVKGSDHDCQHLKSVDLSSYVNLLELNYNLKGLFKNTNVNVCNIKKITNRELNPKEINFLLGLKEE